MSGILLAYFKTERLKLLDEQIRQSTISVINSKLLQVNIYDDDEAEQVLSEELGTERLGKFFIVRNSDGTVLFQTQNISLFELEIPHDPQWISFYHENYFIRALNLKLPRFPDRTLQVGVIIDRDFLSLMYVNSRTLIAVCVIFAVILGLTWFLSAFLFSPVRELSSYINRTSEKLAAHEDLPPIPGGLVRYTQTTGFTSHDEFGEMVRNMSVMVDRIDVTRKFMRAWTFQMAHELKTPLTILKTDIELITRQYQIEKNQIADLNLQINKMSNNISNFLDWAELTSRKDPGQLFVIDIKDTLISNVSGLNKVYMGRVEVADKSESFQVVCNPIHLEQLMMNILHNALKYSGSKVHVEFSHRQLKIHDHGPGIPKEVLAKIGSPFNKTSQLSSNEKGVGLGLAWVKTICDLYPNLF